MQHVTNAHPAQSSIELALKADHQELEVLFERVMASLRSADAERIRGCWLELDRALEQHLSAEEQLMLPHFDRDCPADAARVRSDHHEIRTRLVELGVELDLHSLNPASAARFIDALRGHAAFEERAFYPWSQSKLAQAEQTTLLARLRGALRRVEAASAATRAERESDRR
jgi:hemerythrin superfamily protein